MPGWFPGCGFSRKTARCYLFFPEKEDKSIFEVIEAVFDRAKSDLHVNPVSDLKGIGDLRSRKVKHCVQYRETDFNFVSRTMEKYGVFYYFRFEDGKHTLVLDMKKNYPACEEAEVMFPRASAGAQPTADHITELAARLRVRVGQVVAHRLQLRDAVDVAQGERAQAARRWTWRRATSTRSTTTLVDTPYRRMARPMRVFARKRKRCSTTPSMAASTCRTFTAGTQVQADGSSR